MHTSNRKLSSEDFREYFWTRSHPTDTGCRIWDGAHIPGGYGTIQRKGVTKTAHRLSWELSFGPIPKGLFVCHKCDVRDCVNPHHLFLGTAKDNVQDMIKKKRNKIVRGEDTPNHKLTEVEVIDIMTSTERNKDLAEKYNVSPPTICDIQKGRHWKHITV